ncbi:hypothetical protein BASA50_006840 [Batrachochytrium salamandrivorans]|uniref:Casein kinase substrate phosphoprotein PP28 domain-containing protein n=1 Tax=Batrachochytrium salamandrivorans TaxID=1357716 RepID=A0ABQ8F8Q9_9FUNG|nr:hypothetical protein BASA62_008085 [Batrachochytrium salamandrivorans]KAH6594143.1 hypothetical protein BASA50_006840 [Batrachochytrium salamandrivorans]KAH9273079.1 hypothetical protein BASA83_004656 [Batrachochytrium salamandrivorans]KAJ1332502.1 hypothetical protein BSLG_008804 [Batrachochytrium salamandrivorans]
MVVGGRGKKLNKVKRGGGKSFSSARELSGNHADGGDSIWSQPRGMPPSDDSSEEESSGSEEETDPPVGLFNRPAKPMVIGGNTEEGVPLPPMEIANPNRAASKRPSAKLGNVAPVKSQENDSSEESEEEEPEKVPELSRREREALAKERAKAAYFKLQQEGKTDQARADLARLALIRKQRELTAQKRAESTATTKKGESLTAGKAILTKTFGKQE